MQMLAGCVVPLAYPATVETSEQLGHAELSETDMANINLLNPTGDEAGEIKTEKSALWSEIVDADLIECVANALSSDRDDIDVIDAKDFWRRAVGENRSQITVGELFADVGSRKQSNTVDVRYILAVEGRIQEGQVHGGGSPMAGGGFGYHEERTEAHAVILDVETKKLVGTLQVNASGTMSAAIILVLVVTVEPMTAASACSSLGSAVVKQLPRNESNSKTRVVVVPASGLQMVRGTVSQQKESEKLRNPAKKGDAEAQWQLAVAGSGVVGPEERVLWQCKAAHQGHPDALWHQALDYWYGISPIAVDKVRGYMWTLIAVSFGVEKAASALEERASQLTPDQIAEAERLAAEWQRDPIPCEVEAEMAVGGG
jgi:hypothetical protein